MLLPISVLRSGVAEPHVMETKGEEGSGEERRGEESTGEVHVEQHDRKLGFLAMVAATSASKPGIGCVVADLVSASKSLDVSTLACNSNRCPACFVLNATNPYSLGAVQSHTCPAGGGELVLEDIAICQRAYERHVGTKAWAGSTSSANWPRGCFVQGAGITANFWFNTNAGSWTNFDQSPRCTVAQENCKVVCSKMRTLTIQKCSSMKVSNDVALGSLGVSVMGIDFMTAGDGDVRVSDGTNHQYLFTGRSTRALCGTWSGDLLSFQ